MKALVDKALPNASPEMKAKAIAIAKAESSWNETAVNKNTNGTYDYGLWQINSIHGYPRGKLLDPGFNASAMARISTFGLNWRPWVAYKSGAYKQYLAEARKIVGGTFEGTVEKGVEKGKETAGGIAGAVVPDSIEGLMQNIADRKTWIRAAQVVSGGAFVITGLVILNRDLAVDITAGALGGGVTAPIGAAAKAVGVGGVGGAVASGAAGAAVSKPVTKAAKTATKAAGKVKK
jgi:hypothetical protein